MKISEAARRSGLSIDTIRFYEKSDLLPHVGRGADGDRHFSPEAIDWLLLLASLRETGMPMKSMRHFADLYRRGDATVSERKRMLLDHSVHIGQRREALERCAEILAHKLKRYDEIAGEPE